MLRSTAPRPCAPPHPTPVPAAVWITVTTSPPAVRPLSPPHRARQLQLLLWLPA
ncbi:hypothetical protein SRHO_G00189970 [Serrasalmus rhombeus]